MNYIAVISEHVGFIIKVAIKVEFFKIFCVYILIS